MVWLVVKYSRVPVAVRKVQVLYVGIREVPTKVTYPGSLVWTTYARGWSRPGVEAMTTEDERTSK